MMFEGWIAGSSDAAPATVAGTPFAISVPNEESKGWSLRAKPAAEVPDAGDDDVRPSNPCPRPSAPPSDSTTSSTSSSASLGGAEDAIDVEHERPWQGLCHQIPIWKVDVCS